MAGCKSGDEQCAQIDDRVFDRATVICGHNIMEPRTSVCWFLWWVPAQPHRLLQAAVPAKAHAQQLEPAPASKLTLRPRRAQIIAKLEARPALFSFKSIAAAANGVILSRGNLGLDVPPEKMALVQKAVISNCNIMVHPVPLPVSEHLKHPPCLSSQCCALYGQQICKGHQHLSSRVRHRVQTLKFKGCSRLSPMLTLTLLMIWRGLHRLSIIAHLPPTAPLSKGRKKATRCCLAARPRPDARWRRASR